MDLFQLFWVAQREKFISVAESETAITDGMTWKLSNFYFLSFFFPLDWKEIGKLKVAKDAVVADPLQFWGSVPFDPIIRRNILSGTCVFSQHKV